MTRLSYNSMDVTFFEKEPFYIKTYTLGENSSEEYQHWDIPSIAQVWDIPFTVVTTPTVTTPQVKRCYFP